MAAGQAAENFRTLISDGDAGGETLGTRTAPEADAIHGDRFAIEERESAIQVIMCAADAGCAGLGIEIFNNDLPAVRDNQGRLPSRSDDSRSCAGAANVQVSFAGDVDRCRELVGSHT